MAELPTHETPNRWSEINVGDSARVHAGHVYRECYCCHEWLETLIVLELTGSADYGPSDQDILDQLPAAEEAPFNSASKQNDPKFLEGTRTEVLKQIKAWVHGDVGRCIFWLSGMAGTGKSTIARKMAFDLHVSGHLGASFFFSRGGGDVAHAGLFFTSLAKQLAFSGPPEMRKDFRQAIRDHPGTASKSRSDQWSDLILEPLKQMESGPEAATIVILVDALDECDDEHAMRDIIDLFARASTVSSVKLKIVVTSRPETPIRLGFEDMSEILHRDILLHELPREVVDADICLYLYSEFNEIKRRKQIRRNWPSVDTINDLVLQSSGLFIFAATICRYVLEDRSRGAIRSLESFSSGSGNGINRTRDGEQQKTVYLDKMYTEILESTGQDGDFATHSMAVTDAIGPIVTLFEPLPGDILTSLLGFDEDDLAWRLEGLYSVLEIPAQPEHPIRLFHPSFRDYLIDKNRCGSSRFWIDQLMVHEQLFHCCLRVMRSHLRKDFCGVKRPGTFASDIGKPFINSQIPAHVQYSCRFWSGHFLAYSHNAQDVGEVHAFLSEHLLHWLEVMGWLGRVG